MSRLLIFGSSGQLANELAGLAVEADHDVRALGRAELDLGDPALDLDAAVLKPSSSVVKSGMAEPSVGDCQLLPAWTRHTGHCLVA